MPADAGASQAAARRVILMSTPEFGVPTLHALLRRGYEVVGVICQPDKPAGRGLKLSAPPVKKAALELGVPVIQSTKLSSPEVVSTVQALRPDLILVAAYGNFIPGVICQVAKYGCINLHPSLLPRWRGACPVVAAIQAGDVETGVTVHFVVDEMDAGDVLGQAHLAIDPNETTDALMGRLAELGSDFFIDTVEKWLAGEITPLVQDAGQALWCGRLTKAAGVIDWSLPAVQLARQVRAYTPWPGAFTLWQGRHMEIVEAEAAEDWQGDAAPGQVIRLDGSLAVATGHGALRLRKVQLMGKRILPIEQFESGARGFCSALLG
jgi:methionyl-tRNA formyltransferase